MKLFEMEIPSGLINELPILFNMPDTLMAEIVYETDTLEERNKSIFGHCLFFYITKEYELQSFDELVEAMQQNTDEKLVRFLNEITKRREARYG
jgi:hypothetical protein